MDIQRILSCQKPLELLQEWIMEAQQASQISEPTAMILASASPQGEVTTRTLLLKELGPEGLIFYSNYQSEKGRQLAENPQASLHFYWDPLFRQVRIQGTVQKLSRQKSETYWRSRDRESQLSQWVSRQSEPLEEGKSLDQLVQEARNQHEGREVPCPKHWGGYLLKPELMEFWVGRPHRLHDRVRFLRQDQNLWKSQQLYP